MQAFAVEDNADGHDAFSLALYRHSHATSGHRTTLCVVVSSPQSGIEFFLHSAYYNKSVALAQLAMGRLLGMCGSKLKITYGSTCRQHTKTAINPSWLDEQHVVFWREAKHWRARPPVAATGEARRLISKQVHKVVISRFGSSSYA
eukprot:2014546-Rhodomonas_salina.1